jgi:hypothetical protein
VSQFEVGDVIPIDNADKPDWADGTWRIASVGFPYMQITPLMPDTVNVDESRDVECEYFIDVMRGGLESRRRGNPQLRLGRR